jgi:hypothetical protein
MALQWEPKRDLPPAIQPTVRNGAEAPIAAALAYLGRN